MTTPPKGYQFNLSIINKNSNFKSKHEDEANEKENMEKHPKILIENTSPEKHRRISSMRVNKRYSNISKKTS